jgi:hypothetical protein
MNRKWILGPVVCVVISSTLPAFAQRDEVNKVKPPTTAGPRPAPTPIKFPTPINLDPTPTPEIQTTPAVQEPSLQIQQQPPRMELRPRLTVPGRRGGGDSDHGDCTVRKFTCARSCDPLPAGWSSTQACVHSKCREIEEDCIEELVDDIKERRNSEESFTIFQIKSNYQYNVSLKFYSKDREYFWPNYHEAYVINDYEFHSYRLRCRAGEKICYGAWSYGGSRNWGVGHNGIQGCQNCCRICDGDSGTYTLLP